MDLGPFGQLGFNQNKTKVYLASLQVGSGSVQDIAKMANLPRTTVYEIVMQLVAEGLVSTSTKGGRHVYIAESPERITAILQERKNMFGFIMPELLSLFNKGGSKPRVRYFEGVEGIKRVLADSLSVKSGLLQAVFSVEDLFQTVGKSFTTDYTNRRVEAGIRLQVIRFHSKDIAELWPSSVKERRELRYAPENLAFPMTVYLYDNKVSFSSAKKESFGMIVESADFHNTIKSMFNALWSISEPTQNNKE